MYNRIFVINDDIQELANIQSSIELNLRIPYGVHVSDDPMDVLDWIEKFDLSQSLFLLDYDLENETLIETGVVNAIRGVKSFSGHIVLASKHANLSFIAKSELIKFDVVITTRKYRKNYHLLVRDLFAGNICQ